MAKKFTCWKKTKKPAGIVIYDKNKDVKIIDSPFRFSETDKYQISIFRTKKLPISKFTRTRKEAESFARSYMKKHNVC